MYCCYQARNATGMLPLHLSASGGDARCVEVLLEGAPMETHVVHTKKRKHLFVWRIYEFFFVQARNATGMLTLHLSASGGDARCVEVLLEGAPFKTNRCQKKTHKKLYITYIWSFSRTGAQRYWHAATPFVGLGRWRALRGSAARAHKKKIVPTNIYILIITYVFSVQARNATGMLPLHLSASGSDARCVEVLLEGAPIKKTRCPHTHTHTTIYNIYMIFFPHRRATLLACYRCICPHLAAMRAVWKCCSRARPTRLTRACRRREPRRTWRAKRDMWKCCAVCWPRGPTSKRMSICSTTLGPSVLM